MFSRISKLRELITDSTTAILITSGVNRFYFTSFSSSAGALLVTKNTATLLVDFRYFESAQKKCDGSYDIVCYKKLTDPINNILVNQQIESVVIEDAVVTIKEFKEFDNKLNAQILTDFELSDKILSLRMIKSVDEIEKIKTAQKITEKSYLELLNYVKVGVSERALSNEFERLVKLNGGEKVAFDIISVSGKNTSLPHGVPSDKLLEHGDFITFDIGSVYDGYHSDMTRTIALGNVTDEMREIYDIVFNAHNAATYKIKPDYTCADVDNAAREFIKARGYGEYFGHTTGHGVGLEIHEKPTVYHTDSTVLQSGMVITNEPGIYLPKKFGVRIEDMYLVTDNGCEDLASIDKELLIL